MAARDTVTKQVDRFAQAARTESGLEFMLAAGSALAAIQFNKAQSLKSRFSDILWALVETVGGGIVAINLPEQEGMDTLRHICLGLSIGGASYLFSRM